MDPTQPAQPAPAVQSAPINGSGAPATAADPASSTSATAALANGTTAPTNGEHSTSVPASAAAAPQSIEALKSMNASVGGGAGGGATMGDLANVAANATPAEEKQMDMSLDGPVTSAEPSGGAANGIAPAIAEKEPEPASAPAPAPELPPALGAAPAPAPATEAPFVASSAPPTSTPITAPSSSVAMQPQQEAAPPATAEAAAPPASAEPAAPTEHVAPPLVVSSAAPLEATAAPVAAESVAAQPQQSAAPTLPAPAAPVASSVSAPMTSSPALTASPRTDSQPPAKRQRKDSTGAANLDPSIIIGGAAGEIKLTVGQIKYAQNIIKALKGRNEARAFIAPVDPVALNIPNYPNVVKKPMDLGTVDIKLALTAAAAKGGNKATEKCKLAPAWGIDPERDVYTAVEEFEADVRLTFQNCRTFNGPTHLISQSADVLEAVFDKQMKSFPSADAPMPAASPTVEVPASAAAFPASTSAASGLDRRVSDALITGGGGRPKREIHPPPPRDIVYDEPQALKTKNKKKKSRASMTPGELAHWDKHVKEELKFCGKVIDELLRPSNQDVAWVFYDIPDKSYDFAPAYYAMIKKPISLTMIQKKLKSNGYADGDDFDADMQLLFRNCFAFNLPGSDVAIMGEKLRDRYEDKMSKRPQYSPYFEDDMDEDEPDEATLLARALREQIEILNNQAADLEHGKPTGKALALAKNTLSALGALPDLTPPPKKEPKRRKSVSNGDAAPKKPKKKKPSGEDGGSSHMKKAKKAKKPSTSGGGGGGAGDDDDIRVVTYDQKEELAQKITELPEDRLEGALKIIAEDKPHSANDDEEIELDIDDLSPRTLYRLYRYVVRPKDKKTTNSNPAKSSSDGRKRGTGGKKRKNLDEDEESERIRKLQAQLQQFEGGPAGAGPAGHDDLVASESSGDEEDSDESGSDY